MILACLRRSNKVYIDMVKESKTKKILRNSASRFVHSSHLLGTSLLT